MSVVKYRASSSDPWEEIIGDKGADGQGVPSGGTAGQALVKASSADYDTEWETIPTPTEGSSYLKMPDGTLICWGSASISGTYAANVYFPVAFVDTSYIVQVTWVANSTDVQNTAALDKHTGYVYVNRIRNSGTVSFQWLAIGRWK